MTDIWKTIESRLTEIYSLPHNKVFLAEKGWTLDSTIQHKLKEVRSGINGVPKQETFRGPKTFLRVVGANSQVYSGEWWFDARIMQDLDNSYSRIFFSEQELRAAVKRLLREVLAVSKEWNDMDEVWALNLPGGQELTGFSGSGNPQKLFANKPMSAEGNRMLVGRVRQLYFPVKNPLWITKLRHLS
jgi:hypothetical protein